MYYDLKFDTAWFATSVVDRLAIVQWGILILLLPLAGGVALSWWVGRIFIWSGWYEESANRASAWYKPSWLTWNKVLCLAALF